MSQYNEKLGKGAFKTVYDFYPLSLFVKYYCDFHTLLLISFFSFIGSYRAFDEVDGIEVAWNQIKMDDLSHPVVDLDKLFSEVHILKPLKHANIMKLYHSWVDDKNKTINMITELFMSGTLRQYVCFVGFSCFPLSCSAVIFASETIGAHFGLQIP